MAGSSWTGVQRYKGKWIMTRKSVKQVWRVGSTFTIPLIDGSRCVANVVGRERQVLNSVTIAIHDVRGVSDNAVSALHVADAFSVIMVTKDFLDSGRWAIASSLIDEVVDEVNPYEHLRSSGFIGAKVMGAALVEDFVNAFYGLAPWDDWYVPDFLDGFLVSPDKKPHGRLTYCGRHGAVDSAKGEGQ